MNKNILKIDLETLDNKRQEVLQKLIPLVSNFTLGGGTALALQLSHRKSFDFDFFSPIEIPKKLMEKIVSILSIQNVVVDTSDELTFFTSDNIKITFLSYPFKSHFETLKLENDLQIFPVKEIAVQKAYTIGRRGEYRDYFDLYTILKQGFINLDELMSAAKDIYNGAFDEKIFLEQLVYFDDLLNYEVIPVTGKKVPSVDEVKGYFEKLVEDFVR